LNSMTPRRLRPLALGVSALAAAATGGWLPAWSS
jgi:hypothetical protein